MEKIMMKKKILAVLTSVRLLASMVGGLTGCGEAFGEGTGAYDAHGKS